MKKINLKKAAALLTAGVMTMSVFASCGKSANDTDENGRTRVSVANWPQKEGKELDDANKAKAEFEQQNPDIVIEPDAWTFDLKSFYAKAAGGQLPTLYYTHITETKQIIESGYSADLTNVLKKRGYEGKFNQQILDLASKDGKIYAFPFAAYVLGLGYNVDLFEKAGLMNDDGTPKQPKNWDEVAEFAVKIKEATGKPGIVFPSSNNNGGWIFTPVAWSYGVEFMKKDGDKWKATFDTPEAVAALQYVKDLKWKYDVLPSNSLIDGDEYYKIFGTGNAGMFLVASDYSSKVTQYGMNIDDIGLMAMPAGPKKHVTLLGGSIFAMAPNSTEKQIDGAMRWLERSYNYNATDQFKKSTEQSIDTKLEKGQLVGIKGLSTWDSQTESVKFTNDLIDKKANSNINHVKLYNDFITDPGDCELQAEEPVCAQELYSVLDNCIQEVLTNKDADCATLIKKAVSDFQSNYLDNIDY